jgi:hypothetical protein
MSSKLSKQRTGDANHLVPPPEMSDQVDVIVFPRTSSKLAMKQERLAIAKLMDESGFIQNVLNNSEEECWNNL